MAGATDSNYETVDRSILNRYLAKFDFRQNTRVALGVDDVQRAKSAIRGMVLMYRDSSPAEE
jgi:hypothetical protein